MRLPTLIGSVVLHLIRKRPAKRADINLIHEFGEIFGVVIEDP